MSGKWTTHYEARLRAAAASLSRTLEAEATRVGQVADALNSDVAENIVVSLGAAMREARLLAVLVRRRKAELAGADQPPETELERAERHERFDLAMAGAIQPPHDEDGPAKTPAGDALEDRILQAAGHLRFVYPAGEVGVDSRAWAEVARLRHQGLSWVLEWVRAGHATPPPWLGVGEGQTL